MHVSSGIPIIFSFRNYRAGSSCGPTPRSSASQGSCSSAPTDSDGWMFSRTVLTPFLTRSSMHST